MNSRYFLMFLVGMMVAANAIANDDQVVNVDGKSVIISSWICASQKVDIPNGYYVAEISADLDDCEYPKQRVLIREINYSTFWMCNFDYMGVPAEYEATQTNAGSTCGCRELAKAANGKTYCFTIGARGFLGWPIISVSKHYSKR